MSRKDPAWKYCVEEPTEGEKKGYKYVKCNFCSKVIKGGVSRMKNHLGCTHKDVSPYGEVPPEVKNEMLQYLKQTQNIKFAAQRNFEENVESGAYYNNSGGSVNQGASSRGVRGPMDRYMGSAGDGEEGSGPKEKMTPASVKEQRNQVLGNFGRGLKPPTMHELRTWILKEEVNTTTKMVEDIKETWKTTGVSLLSDGWSDMRNRSLINFLVNNEYGTVFLKTVDASDCIKDAQKIFELLDGVVEEIGEDIVVQVVTDNASNYKAAGSLLMEKRKGLYWTPCAAHCIDLMLEKIGELPQHKNALLKAKKVSNFIYNHQWVLSLARKMLKKDLLRPATTRFATAFLTIQSVYESKEALQQMFISSEWSTCAWAKRADGKEVKKIIMDERNFWPSVVYCIKTTMPLVEVLRLVDGEQKPAMGYIYGAMDEFRWWGEYGDDTPELKEFAMKVLGLTCSASACEHNWSTFNQVHTKRRNRLTAKRMNDLVYIMYNKELKQKFVKKRSLKEEEDPLLVESVLFDDEWLAEPDDEAAIEGGKTGGEGSGGTSEGSSVPRGESSSSGKRKAVQKKVQSKKKKPAQVNLIDEEDEFEEIEDETDEEGDYEEEDDSDEDPFYAV
ncbi:hypothetical protein SSX86_030037 [Deinandra increscens subsp. villosa]|uniref:BED-type domain-containing protein n=1 Tax=Deinandra increscens subsp. villosa TaxID=3103831 RepID=A0AAP0CDP3_9ASTR